MKNKTSLCLVAIVTVILFVFSSCKSRKHIERDIANENPENAVSPLVLKYAGLMAVDEGNITNLRLYSFIDEWMGTPYHFGGQDKTGIDCSGLVQLLQQQVYGIMLPRVTSQQVQVIKRKYENELREGDLVFWDYDGKKFSHVGVYLQNDYVLHASSTHGVTISKLHDPYTYKYFSRCGSVLASQ